MIEIAAFALGGIVFFASSAEDSDDIDVDGSFGETTVDLNAVVERPSEERERADESERRSSADESSAVRTPDASEGETEVAAELPTPWEFVPGGHFCVDAAGGSASDCQDFLGATIAGCRGGMQLSEGADPGPECLDETPEPEQPEDEDVVEAVEDDADSDWDEIVEQIPGQVQQQFASLPIDGGQVAFEEELLGFGLIDRHTNIFAEVETQTFSEELLGIEVEIRVIPVEYHFDYGDGTTRTSATPGAAAQLGPEAELIDAQTATSHVYESTGTYPVAVTSTFIGEYRIAGQSWTPIAASTQVQATGGEADIWRMDTRHVSGACEDPSQWGCDGPFILEEGDQTPEAFRN